jgi:UDP-N-acetylglucosamine 2-epimerase (non-hydrolysing)
MKIKIVVVAGARPNFMKIGPFMKQIGLANRSMGPGDRPVEALLVHTGQHYDDKMSEVFFRELGLPQPDINLGVGSGTHAVQTAGIMTGFEPICLNERPDWVVVVGDVNSTMACSLVCAKLGIRIAHIEAGLRSFDRTMPEEINRLVTDALADLLLTPSEDADRHLLREGIPAAKIKLVGNIMIDALIQNLPQARASRVLPSLGLEPGRFIYVTLHRPANVDDRSGLATLMAGLGDVSRQLPVVFPVHPRTHKMLAESDFAARPGDRLLLREPVGYHASLCLTENARLVLTDSGGLQEEATYFRTPCLTLRPNTERPITITMGSNRLTALDRLLEDVDAALRGPERLGQVPPLWDGHAAERALHELIAVSAC